MPSVTRRQADVDLLLTSPEGRARDGDPFLNALDLDVRRIDGRRKPAIEPVVRPVALDADEAHGDEASREHDRPEMEGARKWPAPANGQHRQARYTTAIAKSRFFLR